MKSLRMLFGTVLVLLATVCVVPSANADDEVATSELTMLAQSGQLSRTVPKPVNWEVEVEIKAPYPQSAKVTPAKEIRAQLPRDMSFNPDPKMPVCPDSKIGPDRNVAIPPDSAIALCPDSVLGNGTAEHYISGNNNANGPTLRDGVVVIFNGGLTPAGLPKIKIYGFSQQALTGIYMEGVLKNGRLDVSIPYLPFDSATGSFHLEIPGSTATDKNRRGQDKEYVRARCSTGTWNAQVGFLMGNRDSGGNPIGQESTLSAPALSIPCRGTGPHGRAMLGRPKVKGPRKVEVGQRATFRIKAVNPGPVRIAGVTASISGKGLRRAARVSVGTLAPRRSKWVRVEATFVKRGRFETKFKVLGRGASSRFVTRAISVSR